MPRDFDWVALIDRKAAIREQFPTLRRLMSERPGCEAERQNRAVFAADNRASVERCRTAIGEQEADADRFIAEMRRKHEEQFTAAFAARQQARRTA